MLKGKRIIGMSILDHTTGKIVNRISDLIYDPKSHKILGLRLDESFQLSRGKHVPFSFVQSFGKDAVTIPNEKAIREANDDPEVKRILDENIIMTGKTVMTEDGEDLGTVTDYYFSPFDGTIQYYEASQNPLTDAYRGTATIPSSEIHRVGEDVIFVSNSVIDILQQQEGGIKQVINQATGNVKEKAGYSMEYMENATQSVDVDGIGQRVRDTGEEVKDRASTLWDKILGKSKELKDKTAQEIEEKRIKHAIGRPVTRAILDKQDNVILDTGEIITHQAIDQARSADALDMLLDSVYVDKPDLTTEDLKAEKDDT